MLMILLHCVSCANPTIVNVIGPNDNILSCKELSDEIAKANKYADEAKEAKKESQSNLCSKLLKL